MEKLGFGALLKTAFKRCVERQLSRIVAMQTLLAFAVMLPLVIGVYATVLIFVRDKLSADWPWLAGILVAMVLYYVPCIYLIGLVNHGMMREILYPEARIGRGLKNGFARWQIALYPIPWFFVAGFVSGMTNALERLLQLMHTPFGISAISVQALGFIVGMAISMVTQFLFCAVAASDTNVSFGDLYKRAFTAVKNGWGRYLGGLVMFWLLCIGVGVITVVPVSLALFAFRKSFPGGPGWWIALFAVVVCLLIYLGFRLIVFWNVYFMNLFVDASGISNAEMGLPVEDDGEAAPEAAETAETPPAASPDPAPETPETPDQDK